MDRHTAHFTKFNLTPGHQWILGLDSEIRWLAMADPQTFMMDLPDLWRSMLHDSGKNVGSSVPGMGSFFLVVVSDQVICCQLCLGLPWPMTSHADMADPVGHHGRVPTDDNLRWGVVDLLMLNVYGVRNYWVDMPHRLDMREINRAPFFL